MDLFIGGIVTGVFLTLVTAAFVLFASVRHGIRKAERTLLGVVPPRDTENK